MTAVLASGPARAAPAADPWFGPDKALHASVSVVLALGVGAGWHSLALGPVAEGALSAGLTLAVGGAKELLDLAGLGTPSWRDFTWDVIGTLVGVLLWELIHQVAFVGR